MNSPKIPEQEHQNDWLRVWQPIIDKRLKLKNPEASPLLNALKNPTNNSRLAHLTQFAHDNCESAPGIFSSLTSKITNNSDPDETINHEINTKLIVIPLLIQQGFNHITHNNHGIDFTADLLNKEYGITTGHVAGFNFSTQKKISELNAFELSSNKLISILTNLYSQEKKKIIENGYQSNGIIIITIDLLEAYEPILSHEKINDQHPIKAFVNSCAIPTIVFGSGSLYIPNTLASKLRTFDMAEYLIAHGNL